jgi:Tfp pilus assembly pilus retraction ATPase PilT
MMVKSANHRDIAMANLHDLLKEMVKGTSDLHITIGSRLSSRINGTLVPWFCLLS